MKWIITLRKRTTIWNYFTTNPQGGGGGSSHRGSKAAALRLALRSVPAGAALQIITYHGQAEINRVEIEKYIPEGTR